MTTDLDFKIQIPKNRTAQNETEPLKLVVKLADKNENISLEQTLYSTSEKIEKITFREIKIGSEVKISANIYDSGILLYTGETEYKKVEPANNVFSLTLEKVNTEDIIDAKVPEIIIQPENKTKNTSEETQELFEHTLHISAQSDDDGSISFQWQIKNNSDEWENIDETNSTQAENLYSSILSVTIPLNTVKYYRCIVTNTNENVNGEKTASITSNEVSVSYLKGELTEITATYNSTGYEIFGSEFSDLETNPNKISIEETYETSNNDKIKIFANAQNYSIQKSTEGENAIGYVPYTVTYNGGTTSVASISNTMYVPVKYELSADSLSISGTPNETATWGTESNPEKVAQHTGSSTLTAKYSSNISLYSKDSSEVADFNILDNCSISWSTGTKNADNSVTVDNSIAGNFTYTVTLTSNSEWIVGEEISTEYYITVCPWEIAIKDSEGKTDLTESKDKLDGKTEYTLFATNEAESPSDEITWISTNSAFSINAGTLSTPEATTETQTATITAKVGETEVASIVVTVAGIEYGTKTNPITDWSMLANKIANTGGDIYISGEMTATEKITVEKETNIIAAKPVTITRDTSFTDTMFTVDAALTIQGTSGNTIIIDGNNINATNTIISSNNISLSYVTIQNCNSSEILGTAISVNNGTFSLQNSILKENSFTYSSIIFDGNSINAEINDCSFEDSIQDLQIYDANSVSISNTSFNRDNCDNIVITKCSELALGENILIPNINYQNYETSTLNIKCSDTTLKNSQIPITIKLSYYTGEYDLNLFVLQNGETVPENIFTLADEKYTINTITGTVEESNNNAGENITGITYAGIDSTTSLPTFYIYNANGLETFRDIVNGTILNETTTSYEILADSSIANGAPYSITNSNGQQNIKGILQADIDLSNIEWTPIGVENKEFAGDFDGNNKSITNLKITDATTTNQGLFGVINNILLREDKSSIKNLKLSGTITSSATNVGGFAGNATNVSFENCENNISISTSNTEIGGLVGIAETCDFANCVNLANISSTSTSGNICVGGIAGYITDVNAEYCYNAGDITGNTAVGGLFGYEVNSTLSNPTYDYCINTGKITANSYFGGILGYAHNVLSFGYCANYGTIKSTSTNNFGCIIGECNSDNKSQVTECLVVGSVETSGTEYYAVSKNASVSSSYYDSAILSITQNPSGGETAKTTNELTNGTDLSNFYGEWSYENGRYPIPDVREELSDYWDNIVTAATPSN